MAASTQAVVANNDNNRLPTGHARQGCRVVHIAVPEKVFNHAKAQAFLSGMRWSKFVERLLADAKPISTSSDDAR